MNETTEFDQIKAQVSELKDGELDRDAARFLLRRLRTDESLREVWSRYHLAGECLRHPGTPVLDSGFSDGVMRHIEQGSPAVVAGSHATDSQRQMPFWLKPVAGVAMAAAVAGMAVFAIGDRVNTLPQTETLAGAETPEPFVSPNAPIAGPAQGNTVPASMAIGSPDPARLNQYLLQQNPAADRTLERSYVPVLILSERPRGVAGVQAPLRAEAANPSANGANGATGDEVEITEQ